MCLTPRHGRRHRGFTLVEAAIVTVIVGIGVVAIVELLAAGTYSNAESARLTTGINLAHHINERALRMDYDDLKTTLDNQTYSPPVDARGVALTGFDNWSQVVDVSYVDPDRITLIVPDTQEEPTSRVTVTARYRGNTVYSTSWLICASEWP